ncbi:hypothetical protein [Kutzneria sp. NPDC052558]|uniref:hypothetical protein n=1 Tax=Kutzneria sp. NPDC052558 TaxID=3364121 RepID=UPI0037CBABE3
MTRLAGVLALALLAAACTSPQAGSASPATTRPATRTTTTTTPPKPTLPKAADGTDLSACADNNCEVQVSAPGPIRLPEGAGATLSVASIGADSVSLSFLPTSDGGFTVGCDAPDPNACEGTQLTSGNALVTGKATAKATANNVTVLIEGVLGGVAVLRIYPAH